MRDEDKLPNLPLLYDSVTNLPNSTLLIDRIQQAIAMAKRQGRKVAFLFIEAVPIDLDAVTSEDKLISAIANRLTSKLREEDTLARCDTNSFVFVGLVDSGSNIHVITDRILKQFDKPYELDGKLVNVAAYIGVSMYPADGETAANLLRKANSAMEKLVSVDGKKSDCQFYQ